MIIFNDTLGAYGGSHTLMLRMCTWLMNRNIRTGIFCDNRNNEEIVSELEILGVKIFVLNIQNPKEIEKIMKSIHEEVKIINFSWNFYLDIERAKAVCKLTFHNLVYCIHAATFQKGIGFKTNFMKNYSVKKYRKIFDRMGQNKALIMMDEVCLRISENYLNLKLKQKPPILRIPMDCVSIQKEKIDKIINEGFESKVIMTASRAEIPYKGYLLGLLDDYVALKECFPDIKLRIIAAGEDINQVEEKIEFMPELYKKDIELCGWMTYDSLKVELETCMFFIGMGTSVLDAALKYKPAIPVKFYTIDNISSSIFADDAKNICAEENCVDKALPLMEQILGYSVDEYRDACYASYRAVKENYDIEYVMSSMLQAETVNKGCILTRKECLTHKLNNSFNSIRYKKTSHFDCRSINKEQVEENRNG